MLVTRFMRSPVVSLSPRATVAEAARRMRDEGVGTVVILDSGRPVGIVTDRDLVVRVLALKLDPAIVPVSEVMTSDPVFLREDASLEDALAAMKKLTLRRVIVVDTKRKPLGVISIDDVLVHLGLQMKAVADLISHEVIVPEIKRRKVRGGRTAAG